MNSKVKLFIKAYLIKFLIIAFSIPAFSQTAIINKTSQIDPKVRESIVVKSTAMAQVKNDINTMKTDVNIMKTDVNTMKTDVNNIKNLVNQATNTFVLKNGDGLKITDIDPYGRSRIWFYQPNSVLKLGGAESDGDPVNATSEGIVVISSPSMARIKADRFGLTSSLDSNLYYWRVDSNNLYYKDKNMNNLINIDRNLNTINLSTINVNGAVYATKFYGDGSGLTGIAGGSNIPSNVVISTENYYTGLGVIHLTFSDPDNNYTILAIDPNKNYATYPSIKSYQFILSNRFENIGLPNEYKEGKISINENGNNFFNVVIATNYWNSRFDYWTEVNPATGEGIQFAVDSTGIQFGNPDATFQMINSYFYNQIGQPHPYNGANFVFLNNGSTTQGRVYICSGGTVDGILTTNSTYCVNNGSTARDTKILIYY